MAMTNFQFVNAKYLRVNIVITLVWEFRSSECTKLFNTRR